jgi:hypothetical protein
MITHAPAPTTHSEAAASRYALVCLPIPEQHDFSLLEAEIRLRRVHIERLEIEIAPLIAALERFEWEYKGRLGALQVELRSIHDQIERLEHRTIRIHARLVADPDGVLGDLFTREELNEIGEMFGIEIPPSWFAREDEDERLERERAWRFHESTGRNDAEEEDILRRMRRATRGHLPEADRQELRSLYLRLARQCHPDLASDPSDLSRRQEMMLRINEAWHAQDLHALRGIEQDRAGWLGWRSLANWAERVLWARRECARLDEQIIALTERLHSLRTNETYPLWFNPDLGSSVITQRVTALRIDIATSYHRLDEAKDAFRQALQHYAAATAA